MMQQVAVMIGRTSWRTVWVVFVLLVLILVLSFYVFSHDHLEHQPWYLLPAPCRMPPTVMADMVLLARHMHEALDRLNVSHALCFGTLWGALRSGRFLPWDNNVDMCAFKSQFTDSSRRVKDVFSQQGMTVDYDWRTGMYAVKYGSAVGGIQTYIVSADGEFAMEGGMSNTFWRWLGGGQVIFPARLLDAPLNKVKFHGSDMPVPHEGIEILKYLYPDNWWLEIKPPGC
ncbi:hypothetical protein BaRGS_00013994 [Batillaria attramentaria]|uniref:LicD/FKTN/FKRP nucleotidyltransferase domain-containing protein n=1 Tax=Batillaria attramentaria TaxID=370345 RepID=A0ABD0L5Z2_9CAEN